MQEESLLCSSEESSDQRLRFVAKQRVATCPSIASTSSTVTGNGSSSGHSCDPQHDSNSNRRFVEPEQGVGGSRARTATPLRCVTATTTPPPPPPGLCPTSPSESASPTTTNDDDDDDVEPTQHLPSSSHLVTNEKNDSTLLNLVVAAIVHQLRQLDPELAALDEQQQQQKARVVPPQSPSSSSSTTSSLDVGMPNGTKAPAAAAVTAALPTTITMMLPAVAVGEEEEDRWWLHDDQEIMDVRSTVTEASPAALVVRNHQQPTADWIQSLAVHMVTLLRHLDPELARLDEEQAAAAYAAISAKEGKGTTDQVENDGKPVTNSINDKQSVQDMENALGELLARVGADATSFVEQCREYVAQYKLRFQSAAQSAVSCQEYAVLPLMELLDPEPDHPLRSDDDSNLRRISSSSAPQLLLLEPPPTTTTTLLEQSEQPRTTAPTNNNVVAQPVVQNHFWQWNAGDVFNHSGVSNAAVVRSSSSSDAARLEVLKKNARDWQTNIASLTSVLQQLPTPTTTVLDMERIERQLQLALDSYLDANQAYQEGLLKQQSQQPSVKKTGLIEY